MVTRSGIGAETVGVEFAVTSVAATEFKLISAAVIINPTDKLFFMVVPLDQSTAEVL